VAALPFALSVLRSALLPTGCAAPRRWAAVAAGLAVPLLLACPAAAAGGPGVAAPGSVTERVQAARQAISMPSLPAVVLPPLPLLPSLPGLPVVSELPCPEIPVPVVPTATPGRSVSPEPSQSASPSATPTATPSATPSASPTPSASASPSPSTGPVRHAPWPALQLPAPELEPDAAAVDQAGDQAGEQAGEQPSDEPLAEDPAEDESAEAVAAAMPPAPGPPVSGQVAQAAADVVVPLRWTDASNLQLPLGAGLALIGCGLALIGLRLRRR